MLERFDRPVRCSSGHLFTTIWIPFASLKAVRLGWKRYQRCPVGRHWAIVAPLDMAARPEELQAAGRVHDLPLP